MEQRMPSKNNNTPIADLVIQDIEARKVKGLESYGTLLQSFNHRNSVQDAIEEALDLACYLKQWQVERTHIIQTLRIISETEQNNTLATDLLRQLGEL